MLLNLAEGSGHDGGDRLYHFRIALGSLREVGAVLDIASAHGWLADAPLAAERDGSAQRVTTPHIACQQSGRADPDTSAGNCSPDRGAV